MPTPHAQDGHFVINGADGLAFRLADQLGQRYGADVVVLMTEEQRRVGRDFTELRRVQVRVVERVNVKALQRAGIATAAGLVLTNQDDVSNIHTALQARELAPELRVVIRMYNLQLGAEIERLLGDCKALSDADIAAPALVATALGEVARNPVEVYGRTLIVARRADVRAGDVLCGLAESSQVDRPAVLPADPSHANLVLAEGRPAADDLISTVPTAVTWPRRWWLAAGATLLRAVISRKSRIALSGFTAVLLLAGAGLVLSTKQLGVWTGGYLTLIYALGGLEPNAELSPAGRVLQVIIGVAGLALVPLITALIVEGMVNARLAVAQGRLVRPQSGHVVLVGLGGVGTRVLRLLHERGVRVVAVEKNDEARGVAHARELGVPLIIGDAGQQSTLRAAGVERCRALMTVAGNDVLNLEAALHGRTLQPQLRVVVRLFDSDLAGRIRKTFNLGTSTSVSYVAAPAFAEALMDRSVIGTISVQRRVLLIAEVIVEPGSALAEGIIDDADEPGLSRVIALAEFGEPRPIWNPPVERRLEAWDRLIAVCTRDGLSQLIGQASADGR